MPQCHFLFSAIFGFRNPTQEIFSKLDVTKADVPIFTVPKRRTEDELKTGARAATPCPGAGQGQAAPGAGVPTLVLDFVSLSDFCFGTVKVGTLAFVTSNFENIYCVAFLKQKTAENRNWFCGILSIC